MALRWLVVSSSPDSSDTAIFDDFRADRKARALCQVMTESPYREAIELRVATAVCAEELGQLLLRHRPDVLHLIAHGNGRALAFEDGAGGVVPIVGPELAALVNATGTIRLVCLESCSSRALAETLAALGPPGPGVHAIGMHFELPSRSGDHFFAAFYRALAASRSIREAFAAGRLDLELFAEGDQALPMLACPRGQTGDMRLVSSWSLRAVAGGSLPLQVRISEEHAEEGPTFIGRAVELARLDAAWNDPTVGAMHMCGLAGTGKTGLVREWLRRFRRDGWRGASRLLTWSFTHDGDVRQFFAMLAAAERRTIDAHGFTAEGARLARRLRDERVLLVLDGVDELPAAEDGRAGFHPAIAALLAGLGAGHAGLCVLVTRAPPAGIVAPGFAMLELGAWTGPEAAAALWHHGLYADEGTLHEIAELLGRHPAALALVAGPRHADDVALAAMRARLHACALRRDPLERAWESLPPPGASACATLLQIADRNDGFTDGDMDARIGDPRLIELVRLGLLVPDPRRGVRVAHRGVLALAASGLREPAPLADLGAPAEIKVFADLYPAIAACQRHIRHGELRRAAEIYVEFICCHDPATYEWSRIARKFQATAEDLQVLAGFFDQRWSALHPGLCAGAQAIEGHAQGFLFHRTGLALRHLGRLAEALGPLERAEALYTAAGRPDRAATCANDRAEILVWLGLLAEARDAIADGLQAAERMQGARELHLVHATSGYIEHLRGDWSAAGRAFAVATGHARTLNQEMAGKVPRCEVLASRPGYYHCEHQRRVIEATIAASGDPGPALAGLAGHLLAMQRFHHNQNIADVSRGLVALECGRLAGLCARRGRDFPEALAEDMLGAELMHGVASIVGAARGSQTCAGVYAEIFLSRAVACFRANHHIWMLPLALRSRARVRAEQLGDCLNARLDLVEARQLAATIGMSRSRVSVYGST